MLGVTVKAMRSRQWRSTLQCIGRVAVAARLVDATVLQRLLVADHVLWEWDSVQTSLVYKTWELVQTSHRSFAFGLEKAKRDLNFLRSLQLQTFRGWLDKRHERFWCPKSPNFFKCNFTHFFSSPWSRFNVMASRMNCWSLRFKQSLSKSCFEWMRISTEFCVKLKQWKSLRQWTRDRNAAKQNSSRDRVPKRHPWRENPSLYNCWGTIGMRRTCLFHCAVQKLGLWFLLVWK